MQTALRANTILLHTLKNTTGINSTISHFGVLIKKQPSPLKKSIPTKEAKNREFPGRFAVPERRRFKDAALSGGLSFVRRGVMFALLSGPC